MLKFALLITFACLASAAPSYNCPPGSCVPLSECPEASTFLTSPLGRDRLQVMFCDHYSDVVKVCCADLMSGAANALVPVPRSGDIGNLLPTQVCGLQFNGLVFGGMPARPGDFPWQVALMRKRRGGSSYLCGGSLISERYALTAAHCFSVKDRVSDYHVRLGEHDFLNDPDCSGRICSKVVISELEHVILHPAYKVGYTFANDIALLRLQDLAPIGRFIIPICLAGIAEGQSLITGELQTAGWGRTEVGLSSNILLKVSLPVAAQSTCQAIYPSSFRANGRQLCLGETGGRDTCVGDSGSPAFRKNRFGQATQLGLVSIGPIFCGLQEAVYTFVPFYLDSFIIPNLRP